MDRDDRAASRRSRIDGVLWFTAPFWLYPYGLPSDRTATGEPSHAFEIDVDMNSTGFQSPISQTPRWRDWTWQAHVLMWVFPAAMLVTAAPAGAKGLAMETGRLLCWVSSIGLQVLLCPRRPSIFGSDDPSSRMKIWPLGLWQDGHFASLWRLSESGMTRVFLPVLGNLAVALTSALILGISSVQMTWNPFVSTGPWNLEGQEILSFSKEWWLGQFGHAHWVLALAALIPAGPLAGGLAVTMLLDQLQWRDQEARQVRRITAYASVAFLAILGTMLVANQRDGGYCVILVALVVGLETRKQAKRDAAEAFIEDFVLGVIDEDDFEAGLERIEKRPATIRSRVGSWIQERRRRRAIHLQKNEILRHDQDEARLDRILEAIHQTGYGSLPRSDRRFLKQMAKRYQARRDDGDETDA